MSDIYTNSSNTSGVLTSGIPLVSFIDGKNDEDWFLLPIGNGTDDGFHTISITSEGIIHI